MRRALHALSIAGHISVSWLAQDVDELGCPCPGAQRVWSMTDAGVDELDWLQAEAGQ